MVRAIRGAVTATANDRESILAATCQLLEAIVTANGLDDDSLISAIFTVTADLDAAFPAEAARAIGWNHVPLLCAREIAVPGSLPRCIRILVHVATDRVREAINHVYLGAAAGLRPDLTSPQ